MKEVLAGMNSCISTATTVNCNGLFKDAAQAILQNFLNTQFIGLSLPAKIIGSFISDVNKISQM
jgi:hypothetical protein